MVKDDIVDEIEAQDLLEGLIGPSRKIEEMAAVLLKGGMTAVDTARVVADLNDRLAKKILQLAEEHLGPPPAGYCWIAFGSEGRREQILRTDQDNALVFASTPAGPKEEVREYFSAFGRFVADGLMRCGFPACPASYMASNPQWCQPLGAWKRYFAHRVFWPTPQTVVNSMIFFDLRPLYGDFSLSDSLDESLMAILNGQMIFLGYMAGIIVRNVPPEEVSGPFFVEENGRRSCDINLKVRLLLPIVDIVRLFSLEKGIRETSTAARISALRRKDRIIRENAEALINSLEFALSLRARHQFEKIRAGNPPDDIVNGSLVSADDRKTMQNVFRLLSRLQDAVKERYRPLLG